jgi:hypothetical protein
VRYLIHRHPFLAACIFQRLNGDIQPDAAAIFETVGNGFGDTENGYIHVLDRMLFNARHVCCTGCADDP